MTRTLLTLAMISLSSACFLIGDEGRGCEETADCGEPGDGRLECVLIEGEGTCLPAIERAPTTCASVEDCVLFPVEATCTDGACQCSDADLECEDGEIVDVRRCVCVESNGERGEFCNDDQGCTSGLSCEDDVCSRGDAVGDVCSFSEPCVDGFTCESANICLISVGEPCSASDDCFGFCVNGRCDEDQGTFGDGCADDVDCDTLFCSQGTCE